MIKLGYEMQFRLVRLRNRVWLRGLLGIEMHLRLVVSRLTICARRRRLQLVVCYHRYNSTTTTTFPAAADFFRPRREGGIHESRQQTQDAQ